MGDLIKARDFALKAVIILRKIHASLTQEDDQLKIGNFEKNQAKTFNLLQYVLTELGQNDAALLISELGRVRTLADLMQSKIKTSSQLTSDVSKFISEDACINESMVCDLCSHIMEVASKLKSTLIVYSLVDNPCSGKSNERWLFIWVISSLSSNLIFSKKLMEADGTTNFQLDEEYLSSLRRDIGVSHQQIFRKDSAQSDSRDIKLSKAKGSHKHTAVPLDTGAVASSNMTSPGEQLNLLYDVLIDPIIDRLLPEHGSDPRLIFVPQGVVFNVPFAALRKNNHYLIESFILSQIPSLSILDQLVNSIHCTGQSAAFVVGNPVMPHEEICQLPGAEQEAKTVHRIMGGKLLLNEQVTKKAVQEHISSYSVIHLACLLYTSPSPRDATLSRMPSSA